jgi:hypothetical protein
MIALLAASGLDLIAFILLALVVGAGVLGRLERMGR